MAQSLYVPRAVLSVQRKGRYAIRLTPSPNPRHSFCFTALNGGPMCLTPEPNDIVPLAEAKTAAKCEPTSKTNRCMPLRLCARTAVCLGKQGRQPWTPCPRSFWVRVYRVHGFVFRSCCRHLKLPPQSPHRGSRMLKPRTSALLLCVAFTTSSEHSHTASDTKPEA